MYKVIKKKKTKEISHYLVGLVLLVYLSGGYYITIWWLTPVRQWARTPVTGPSRLTLLGIYGVETLGSMVAG